MEGESSLPEQLTSFQNLNPENINSNEYQSELLEKYKNASKIGQNVVEIARQREIGKYTTPFIEINKLPQEWVKNCSSKNLPTQEDIDNAEKSSLKLFMEANFQIISSKNKLGGVVESRKSVLDIDTLLSNGKRFIDGFRGENENKALDAYRSVLSERKKNGNYIV